MTGPHQHPKTVLYHLFWCAIDWLYPPFCGGCEQPGNRWCPACQAAVRVLESKICRICGGSLSALGKCPRCAAQTPAFSELRSWGMYEGPLRNAIHSLKYERNIGLAESLSTHLAGLYDALGWGIDLVVAVPLSPSRRLERGYNQASLLAYPLALTCRLPYSSRAIRKVRETRSQVGLTLKERQQNVKDAFAADRTIVSRKSVLVVDDVATTGATQQACASALLEAGASTVYGLTLARAVFKNETAGETQAGDHLIS